MSSSLLARTRSLLAEAADRAEGTEAAALIADAGSRLDDPLRVAIAGKVKAGKSTLLNALIGERLAPTDAGECTRIVTWYREGVTYGVTAEQDGTTAPLGFSRGDEAIEIDLGGRDPAGIDRLVVAWPSSALSTMTLIDTPGLESLSTEVSARTTAFLTQDDERPSPVDAVLYLMRHVHASDVRFLESFHADDADHASPVNAIGVLSRVDEVGGGRLDSLDSADRIAHRYRSDDRLRRFCQTVVPVAGLLAETGATLTEAEYRLLGTIGETPAEDLTLLLASADQFSSADLDTGVVPRDRRHLLARFGLYGVRVAISMIREQSVSSATDLADELIERSGLPALSAMLRTQFAQRADLLKSRSALAALGAILEAEPHPGADRTAMDLERVLASAHELAEGRVLTILRTTDLALSEVELDDAETLLGIRGSDPAERLGLAAGVAPDELKAAAIEQLQRWRGRQEDPTSPQAVRNVCQVLVRTCEGLFAALAPTDGGGG